MTELVTIVKKYGVTGILCAWLWHTDSRLNKVEEALYDCYKESTIRKATNTNIIELQRMYAILPNEKTNRRHLKA